MKTKITTILLAAMLMLTGCKLRGTESEKPEPENN